MTNRKRKGADQAPSTKDDSPTVVAIETTDGEKPTLDGLDEVSDQEISELLVKLDGEYAAEAAAEAEDDANGFKYATVEALLAVEEQERAGIWRRWPQLEDAEVLIGGFTYAIQEQARLTRKAQRERAMKSRDPAKTAGLELPAEVNLLIEAKARFGKSVLGWRGKSLDSLAFNFPNFLRLWKSSIAFRAWANGESVNVRTVLDEEAAKAGKA